MSKNKTSYEASDVTFLKGIHAVRKRPGMYIGDTDREGLHHLIFEITDNSVDEALAGYCNQIEITFEEDNSVSIKDNGRGIPVAIHPEENISAATLVFTELHAGGKFGGGGYKVSGGLHGVGATVTNALSEYLEVYIKRDGNLNYQRFEKGIPVDEMKAIAILDDPEETGTTVRFKPDPEMFPEAMEESEGVKLSMSFISERLKRTSYLAPKLRFIATDSEGNVSEYYSERGIAEYVEDRAESLYPTKPKFDEEKDEQMFVFEPVFFKDSGSYVSLFDKSEVQSDVEISFTYQNKFFDSNILSFANNINTSSGGKHVVGFENALLKVVNDYNIKEMNGTEMLTKEDVMEGINAVISYKTEDPKFSDQTKKKLAAGDAQKLCYRATKEYLENKFEIEPEFAKTMVSKALESKKMRVQIEKKRNEVQKNVVSTGMTGKPKKLADCSIKTREGTELFLVEGDSAGGSAKQGRDRKFQAILPLKGKILNALKSTDAQIEASEEVKNLELALKAGVGENYNPEKLRYEKIIIMCDADVDGAHIELLALTYLKEKMPQLLKDGHVYLAQPPLYVLKSSQGGSKQKTIYVQDDEELEQKFVKGMEKQRFKGLGEMNPEQLWETTMNPENRHLVRVVLNEENELEAENVFEDLMGKKIENRKKFIFDNAINVSIEI